MQLGATTQLPQPMLLPNLVNGLEEENLYNTDSIKNVREERRVKLQKTLFIRRLINSNYYARLVTTIDVSRDGACIVVDIPKMEMEPGMTFELFNSDRSFSAIATVRHHRIDEDGHLIIGLLFTEKNGQWIIPF